MKINALEMYKVIEGDGFIMVLPRAVSVPLKHVELAAGDPYTVGEYLLRYLYERKEGKGIMAAHNEALREAIVVGRNDLTLGKDDQTLAVAQ